MENIIITVGGKKVKAIAARFTAYGAAIIYTTSGPVEVPRDKWQKVGIGGFAVQSSASCKLYASRG